LTQLFVVLGADKQLVDGLHQGLTTGIFTKKKKEMNESKNGTSRKLMLPQGRKNKNEIQLFSGPVNFSFQFPPLKYQLLNRSAIFIAYEVRRLLRLFSML